MVENKNNNIEELIGLFQKKDYKNSVNLANSILLNESDNIVVQNILALSLKNIGKRTEAIELFNSLIIDHPEVGYLYANLANIYLLDGKLNDALVFFEKAIKYDSKLENAYNGLGNTLIELGNLEEALNVYKKALLITKNPKNVHYNIGNIYRKLEVYDKAADHYSKTDVLLSHSHHLECLYLMNRKKDFIKNLEKLENDEILSSLASCLGTHSRIRYGLDKKYSFCDNPFSYIYARNILDEEVIAYDDINNLNNELKLMNLDFKDQALLNKGNQSAGNIFFGENKIIKKIEKVIEEEINSYRKIYKGSNDKYISLWPNDSRLFGWIIRMNSGGNLDAHIHKEGWLSGSLYFKMPTKKSDNEGNIVFSLDGANYPTDGKEFHKKSVDLNKGDLVLFPSSLFHGTLPFKSNEERVTFAFDIIPQR